MAASRSSARASRPRFAWSLALITAGLLAFAPSLASADEPPPEAKERFERGIARFQNDDFNGALGEFKRAYELAPYSVVLYNLALTYAALDRPIEAAEAMTRVLDDPGSLSPDRLARAEQVLGEERAKIGRLSIDVDVEGARIEIDGVDAGQTPLAQPLEVKGGAVRVAITKSGYVPSRRLLDVPAGGTETLEISLEPATESLARVTVATDLLGAEVLLNGSPVATTPLAAPLVLKPGQYRIEVRRQGYETAVTDVLLSEGARSTVTLEPRPDESKIAALGTRIRMDVSEDDAIVLLDGEPVGRAEQTLSVAPGLHRLSVKRAGFYDYDRDLDLAPGEVADLRVRLEPEPETLASYNAEASTFRALGIISTGVGVALAGGGVAFLLINQGEKDEAEEAIEARNAEFESGGRCDPSSVTAAEDEEFCSNAEGRAQQDAFDSAKSRDVIGYIGLGVGGAAVVAGVILLIAGPDPGRYDPEVEEELVSFGPVVNIEPSRAWIGVGGTF